MMIIIEIIITIIRKCLNIMKFKNATINIKNLNTYTRDLTLKYAS